MDWSKAKNILIIAFVITNLILGYVLIDNRASENATSGGNFNSVKEKLSGKNIEIDPETEIPLGKPSLSKLNVEYQVYDTSEITNLFLENSYEENTYKDRYIYTSGDEKLIISDNNKKLIYTKKSEGEAEEKYLQLNEKKLNFLVNTFLDEKGFVGNDHKLFKYDFEDDTHILEYVQVYKGIYVEETRMKFEIDKTGVIRFERCWFNINGVENKVIVKEASNALISLLSEDNIKDKTIKEISLCYYFDSQIQDKIDSQNIMAGQAIPAWRVEFTDGTKKFLK